MPEARVSLPAALRALERTVEHEVLSKRRRAPIDPAVASAFLAAARAAAKRRADPQAAAEFRSRAASAAAPDGAAQNAFAADAAGAAASASAAAPAQFAQNGAIPMRLQDCEACPCRGKAEPVEGAGNKNSPDYMFVCDGPAAAADSCGGILARADFELLEKMLSAMGTGAQEVFIAAAIKCRPPDKASAAAAAPCAEWLRRQAAEIRPKCIVAMGDYALRLLAGQSALTVKNEHGKLRMFEGIPLVPTYAPSYLNKFPSVKKDAWKDLKIAMAQAGAGGDADGVASGAESGANKNNNPTLPRQ